jgi:hypothetical protein
LNEFSLKYFNENSFKLLNLKNFSSNSNLNYNDNLPDAVKIYKNLHTIETQLLIKKENLHKAGIYCVYNTINGKFYIGSAINNRINTRFRNHCIHGTGSSILNKAIKDRA